MTLRSLAYWRSHGEPYRLARPLRALADCLEGYGYVVYDYPDDDHLEARTPEDHTPFSATGWPVESPFGVGFADDVMPPAAHLGLPTIAQLAEQILFDKAAGLPDLAWLKYMNSTDSSGACWQDSWKPDHARRTSTDKGHIHLSGRSDMAGSPVGDHYDPVARYRARKGGTVFLVKLAEVPGQPAQKYWLTDGLTRRWVQDAAQLDALLTVGIIASKTPRVVKDVTDFGVDLDAERPVVLTAADKAEIITGVAREIVVPVPATPDYVLAGAELRFRPAV